MNKKPKYVTWILTAVIIVSMLGIVTSSALALTDGEQGIAFLLSLNDKGVAKWAIDGPFLNVYVEPKTWFYLSHAEKEEFARQVLNAVSYLNNNGQKIGFFSIFNMTSHEQLAKGNIAGGGKINIVK
jgi:hypothetical protein